MTLFWKAALHVKTFSDLGGHAMPQVLFGDVQRRHDLF